MKMTESENLHSDSIRQFDLINDTFRSALQSIQLVVDSNATVVDKKEQVVERIQNIAAIAEEFSSNTEQASASMENQANEIASIDKIVGSIHDESLKLREEK